MPVDISVIIVNWNTRDLLLQAVASVYETVQRAAFEIWVVDNASTDGSTAALQARYPQVHLIANRQNRGFAAANNQAFDRMQGRYALLLNSDSRLTPGAAETLLDFMENRRDAAMACGQLLNRDGSPQRSVAAFPGWAALCGNETLLRFLRPGKYPGKKPPGTAPRPVDSCIGACMMVRHSALAAVGGFDERYFFFLEETDWALRMRKAGWGVYFVPAARIYHDQGMSVGASLRSRALFYRSRYRYFRKWYPRLWPLAHLLVFLRLLVNTLLTAAGAGLTLGRRPALTRKLGVYCRLIGWHLKGCPDV